MSRLKAANNARTTLTQNITASATSFSVADASLFPATPFRITCLNANGEVAEIMEAGTVSGTTFSNVQRGLEGTTPVEHSAGTYIENRFTSGMHNELITASEAPIQSVNSKTGNVVLNADDVGAVAKIEGKGLSTEDYTTAEKQKLAGVETGANKYSHPSNHPATMITQDSTHRFVTDSEKDSWNGAISDINNRFGKSVKDISGTDLDTIIETGIYAGSYLNNNPLDAQAVIWIVEVGVKDSNFIVQKAYMHIDNRLFVRRKQGDTWQQWFEIPNMTHIDTIEQDLAAHLNEKATEADLGHVKLPENWINATLQNGWTNISESGGLKFFKDDFDIVHISGQIKDGITTVNTIITTLPVGYRPRTNTIITGERSNDASVALFLINYLGEISVRTNNGAGAYALNVSFRAV